MTDPSTLQRGQSDGVVEYHLPGGWQVLAGRTDAANDYLSLKLAHPNDLWFHIRGMPGSHVVLRVPKGRKPDRETQECAAAIAAFHSKARKAGHRGGIVHRGAARLEDARHETRDGDDPEGNSHEGPAYGRGSGGENAAGVGLTRAWSRPGLAG
jgi:hypothetical protein